jgi:hypothetical protein
MEHGFPGYGGFIRIDPVNLTFIKQKAESAGLTVNGKWMTKGHETFRNPNFLGAGTFYFEYHPDDNHTLYHFEYRSEVPDEFWSKLAYYLNLSEAQLTEEIQYFNETREEREQTLGKAVEAKPCWGRILQNQRTLVNNQTNEIGYYVLEYGSGIEITRNTEYLAIEKDTELNGTQARVRVLIDSDSDIEVMIECGKPIQDPMALLKIMAQETGLPDLQEKGLVLYARGRIQ